MEDMNALLGKSTHLLGKGSFGMAIGAKDPSDMPYAFKVIYDQAVMKANQGRAGGFLRFLRRRKNRVDGRRFEFRSGEEEALLEASTNKLIIDNIPKDIVEKATCILPTMSTFLIVPTVPLTAAQANIIPGPCSDDQQILPIPRVICYQRGISKFAATNLKLTPFMFMDIIQFLKHMHSKNLSHNDIKPDNLIWGGKTLKCLDFGLCESFYDAGTTTLRFPRGGTPAFMSAVQLGLMFGWKPEEINKGAMALYAKNIQFMGKYKDAFHPDFLKEAPSMINHIISIRNDVTPDKFQLHFFRKMLCKVDEIALALSILDMEHTSDCYKYTRKLTDWNVVIDDWGEEMFKLYGGSSKSKSKSGGSSYSVAPEDVTLDFELYDTNPNKASEYVDYKIDIVLEVPRDMVELIKYDPAKSASFSRTVELVKSATPMSSSGGARRRTKKSGGK
jgi:hypothetical protein